MKKRLLFLLSAAAFGATRSDMLVSADWLAQHLNDPKVIIVHVSANKTAYDAGHIPGARFIPQSDLVVTRDGIPNELPPAADLVKVFAAAGVTDDTRVILYGDASALPPSRAYFTLDYLGHEQTALLDGGLDAWKAGNRELNKDVPQVAAGKLTAKINSKLVVQMDDVKASKASASATILDVRSAAEYKGEKGSHIPGALNMYWMDTQTSNSNQVLKSESAMRSIAEGAGIPANKPVMVYCNSGMQASQSYFTLKYLGYDVKLYDGSMSEWNAKGGQVEK